MPRFRKLWLVAIAGIVLVPLAGISDAAAYTDGPHQCLLNASSYCIDIKNSVYSDGQALWLYGSGANANAFEGVGPNNTQMGVTTGSGNWYPFTNHTLDTDTVNDSVIVLYAQNSYTTDLCAAEASGDAQLNDCTGSGVLWVAVPYNSGYELVNVAYSDSQGTLEHLTASDDSNGATLDLESGSSGWINWNVGIDPNGCVPEPPCY